MLHIRDWRLPVGLTSTWAMAALALVLAFVAYTAGSDSPCANAQASCPFDDDSIINGDWVLRSNTAFDVIVGHSATADATLTIPDTAGAADTFVMTAQTQTLTNKSLTAPVISGAPTAAGSTWGDLGSITTADINGGSVDVPTIGASSPGTIVGTTIDATTDFTVGNSVITDGVITDATGLQLAADVDLANNDLTNIGNAGTDITSTGATFAVTFTANADGTHTFGDATATGEILRIQDADDPQITFTEASTARWSIGSGREAFNNNLVMAVGVDASITPEFELDTGGDLTILGSFVSTAGADTLGGGATTFAITSGINQVDCDGGGNTIATITGGTDGQTLILLFVDADCIVSDDDTHTANTVDLSGAFTSADDTTLTILQHGGSWYETARSVN